MVMVQPKLTIASGEQPKTDGRVRRSERSRQKIIDAFMALVREGHFDPSAQAVAEKARDGLRSVFRH